MKPGFYEPSQDVIQKIILSLEEVKDMKMRPLKCPACKRTIEGVYSDGIGHMNIKCKKCGFAGPVNLAYFRRKYK